ncbi:alanine racemase [Paenibacillus sp. OAS669]|uniref:alanine racemase n=1 Tax=Paenibacillus sp. OAS669 TaxID=2663821 RepID=UPI00178BF1C0|nr:alanine racemase [Paenibacillus sp. OAS669]MBE1445492.1 alanine racemase [Paenibacillus sp. OAS669]
MYSYRDTRAEVSLDAIAFNTAWFKQKIGDSCRMMAVVKADAYGHGAVETAKAAVAAGADYLGVAIVDEALQLRKAGIECPILVLGYTAPRAVEAAIRHRIALTVFTNEVLDCVMDCSYRLQQPAVLHIKIDTGMSRLGITEEDEVLAFVRKASRSPYLRMEGIFTHFAQADHDDTSYTWRQYEAFAAILRRLKQEGLSIPIAHCCNSAAAQRFPSMHMDMVRIGISLYGLIPSPGMKGTAVGLRQAFQLKSSVASLKQIPAGQPISYGGTFRPERESMIAVIPIGYADGLSRALSNRGSVLIHGHRAPIVGTICMDQTMLDVTDMADVRVGDEVILYGGGEGSCGISMDEAAALQQTINYEIVCTVGRRVPRLYLRDGQVIGYSSTLLDAAF